jgi:lipoyl-dependent peroxiredoxin
MCVKLEVNRGKVLTIEGLFQDHFMAYSCTINHRRRLMKIAYTAHAKANGNGRNGISATDDGRVTVTLASPTEMGGSGHGTNPEQLFATGYAACYLGAMRYAAGQGKIEMPASATVGSHVSIGPRDDGLGFGLEITLDVSLPGMTQAAADDLAARGHVVCPYSHSIKGNVNVTTKVSV